MSLFCMIKQTYNNDEDYLLMLLQLYHFSIKLKKRDVNHLLQLPQLLLYAKIC